MQVHSIVLSIVHTEHYVCASYEVITSTGSMRPAQSWTVCPVSHWSTAAALAPHRLGPGLCGEVSVKRCSLCRVRRA